jgi:hypothetical protein
MLFLSFSRHSFWCCLSVWSLSPSRKVSWLGFLLVDVVSRLVFLFCNLRGRSMVSAGSSLRGERDAEAWGECSCPCVPRRLVVLGAKRSEDEAGGGWVNTAMMAGPLGVVVVDVLAMSYTVRGSTGTASTVIDFSASGSRVRGLLGLLRLGFLCTPSRRSSEVAERAAEPPILNRRCQLERRAWPFLSGGGLESDDGVRGLSALAALLECLRSCEFLLYSSLSGTGGSTAPCPCGSLSLAAPDDDNDNDEGPRGTKGAASAVADDDDDEVVEAMRFGDGGSRRGLLRERALGWLWVAVCTNMAWLLPDR